MELEVTKSEETTATPVPSFETAAAHNLPLIGFAEPETVTVPILGETTDELTTTMELQPKITDTEIDAIKAVLDKEKRRKENVERYVKVDTQKFYVLDRKFMNKMFWSLIIRRADVYTGLAMKMKIGELFGAKDYQEIEEITSRIRDEFLQENEK